MALPSSTSAEYSVVVHCTILRSAQCAYWALYYNLNTAQCTILCMLLNLPYCGTLLLTNQCSGEIKSWNDAEQVPCVKSVADSTHWFPKNMIISPTIILRLEVYWPIGRFDTSGWKTENLLVFLWRSRRNCPILVLVEDDIVPTLFKSRDPVL